ncbi:hypothetical protein BJF83_12290 [Nocardiopsis sp. CNR-923]|nr:hypothetical protein BJF83_12290 [Nocardiopsis sp. CNR-923]
MGLHGVVVGSVGAGGEPPFDDAAVTGRFGLRCGARRGDPGRRSLRRRGVDGAAPGRGRVGDRRNLGRG